MKVIRLLHFDFPAKLGGRKVCLMHWAFSSRSFGINMTQISFKQGLSELEVYGDLVYKSK